MWLVALMGIGILPTLKRIGRYLAGILFLLDRLLPGCPLLSFKSLRCISFSSPSRASDYRNAMIVDFGDGIVVRNSQIAAKTTLI